MPTPTDIFIEIAARYGGVDRENLLGVQRWYEHELEKLPEETIDEILDELLRHEDTPPADHPRGVTRRMRRCPSSMHALLQQSHSPPGGSRFFGGWRAGGGRRSWGLGVSPTRPRKTAETRRTQRRTAHLALIHGRLTPSGIAEVPSSSLVRPVGDLHRQVRCFS